VVKHWWGGFTGGAGACNHSHTDVLPSMALKVGSEASLDLAEEEQKACLGYGFSLRLRRP
jgi:hypothetical protein